MKFGKEPFFAMARKPRIYAEAYNRYAAEVNPKVARTTRHSGTVELTSAEPKVDAARAEKGPFRMKTS